MVVQLLRLRLKATLNPKVRVSFTKRRRNKKVIGRKTGR